jgi:hypothetical protein
MVLAQIQDAIPAFTTSGEIVILDDNSYVYVVHWEEGKNYFIGMCEETGQIVDNVAGFDEFLWSDFL